MDKAELWLKNNDPCYEFTERKKLQHPYLTNSQMRHRIGASNCLGKEIPLTNILPLKGKLGIKDRRGDADSYLLSLINKLG